MEEPQDLSFEQAKQKKIAAFTAEIRQHVEQRLDLLQRGLTVAEAIADIPDPHLRQAVQAGLLYAHALSLSDGLCNLGVLTHAQADEEGLSPPQATRFEPVVRHAPALALAC